MKTETLTAVEQCFVAGGGAEALARIREQEGLEQMLLLGLQRMADHGFVGRSHMYWGEERELGGLEYLTRSELLKSLLPSIRPEEHSMRIDMGSVLDRAWLRHTQLETSGEISMEAVDRMLQQTLEPDGYTTWLFMGGNVFGKMFTKLEFMERFTVETNAQALARGEVGVLRYQHHNIPVSTDAYRHPHCRALRPNEVVAYTGPGDWGVSTALDVIGSEVYVQYNLMVTKPTKYSRVLFGPL